jgi:hypothetical protein
VAAGGTLLRREKEESFLYEGRTASGFARPHPALPAPRREQQLALDYEPPATRAGGASREPVQSRGPADT